MLRQAKLLEHAPAPNKPEATDKVSRYKWTSVGQRGKAMDIKKTLLCVDDSYQRGEVMHRAQELARDWWWMACGALTVMRRKNGALVIIDGQHRWLAACRRSDIDEMPCVVFDEMEGGVADEAAAFVKANTNRKTVRSSEMFRARVVAGEDAAKKVQELITSIGRQIGNKSTGNTVACVGAMIGCISRNEPALRRIWPLIAEICEGVIIADTIVKGLHHIENRIYGESSLASPRWAAKIRKLGATGLMQAAESFANATGRRTAGGWAQGMAIELNKGMRTNRLPDDKQ